MNEMKVQIGAHSIMVDNDILVAHVTGPMPLDQMKQFLDVCAKTLAQHGSVYLISIMGPGYAIPPDSRRYVAEWGRSHRLDGNLIVGAPFAMRALLTMLSRASKLFGVKNSEIEFAVSEAEAHRWIAQHKARQSRLSPSHPST